MKARKKLRYQPPRTKWVGNRPVTMGALVREITERAVAGMAAHFVESVLPERFQREMFIATLAGADAQPVLLMGRLRMQLMENISVPRELLRCDETIEGTVEVHFSASTQAERTARWRAMRQRLGQQSNFGRDHAQLRGRQDRRWLREHLTYWDSAQDVEQTITPLPPVFPERVPTEQLCPE